MSLNLGKKSPVQTIGILVGAIVLLVGPISPSAVNAQQWAQKMFKETKHDFGAVARGAKCEYIFEIENVYEEELHIASVRSSCGCTTPIIQKNSVKTWEKTGIVAQLNTISFMGKKSAVITVVFDKPYYAEVQLLVSGHIRTDIVTEPGEIHFGQIDQGATKTQTVRLAYAGRPEWRVTDVRSANEHLEVALKRAEAKPGFVDYIMSVRLKESAPVGDMMDLISVVTNDSKFERFSLPVTAQVMPPVSVAPASIQLGSVAVGEVRKDRIVVKGKSPFRIAEVSCEDERFKFQIPSEEKSVHLLNFEFVGQAAPGGQQEFKQRVLVKTTLGESISAECVVSGNVIN